MKPLHEQGLGTTHGSSTFELAVKKLKAKATDYFKESNKKPSAENQKKLNQAFRDLDKELRFCFMMCDLQTKLDKYRATGNESTKGARSEVVQKQQLLIAEKHHPAKTLGNFLRAAGKPRPSPAHSAHHIIPGKGKTEFTYRARVIMHALGIRINDPDNGAWLIRNKNDIPHWSMSQSKSHLQYHTENYERWIFNRMSKFTDEATFRHKLNLTGKMLQQGNVPVEIGLPPDPDWNGA